MKLLVISDSHRGMGVVDEIIGRYSEAKHVFFLGDNTDDIEDLKYVYPEKSFHIVSGNCDYFPTYPNSLIEKIEGVNILYTHGHTFGVKEGIDNLMSAAKAGDCKIVLYGHTHISDISYKEGIYFVNPGSCRKSRNGLNSFALIEITQKGIMPSIITI